MVGKKENAQSLGSETGTAKIEKTAAARPKRRRRSTGKRRGGATTSRRTHRRAPRRTRSTRPPEGRRRTRRRYSDAERQRILSTAQREALTAVQVQQRYGVTPVTYYTWRRKSGSSRRRAGRTRRRQSGVMESGLNLVEAIRGELRAQIQRILPELVRTEVGAALLGLPGRRGNRRRG